MKAYLVVVHAVVGPHGRRSFCKVAVFAPSSLEAEQVALRLSLADPAMAEFDTKEIAPGSGIVVSRG